MNFAKFSGIMNECKSKNPFWFIKPMDPPASDEEISKTETCLGVKFPEQYLQFVKTYGGGVFASIDILSVNMGSKWNIVAYNEIDYRKVNNFITVSDDHSGGYYGWIVKDGVCDPHISYYDWETNDLLANRYEDLFEFIVEVAFTR